MLTTLFNWFNRRIISILMIAAISGSAVCVGIILSVFYLYSSSEANEITERSSTLVKKALADSDNYRLPHVSSVILSNPSVHSIQIYSVADSLDLAPVYGDTDNEASYANWYTKLLSPLLSPLFHHEQSRHLENAEGEGLGYIHIHFLDFRHAQAAIHLSSLVIALIFISGGIVTASLMGWRQHQYTLVKHLHKEAATQDLLAHSRPDGLQHDPWLQRLHSLIRAKKREHLNLIKMLDEKDKQIALYDDLLKKHHYMSSQKSQSGSPAPFINTNEINHLLSLTDYLSKAVDNPHHRAASLLIHQSLVQYTDTARWSVSSHGKLDAKELISVLHQVSFKRDAPPVLFYPDIPGKEAFQGKITDVVRAKSMLLDLASNQHDAQSPMRLSLLCHPQSHHLMLTCHLSCPTGRKGEDAVTQVSQRKAFIEFKGQLEAANAKVSLHPTSESGILIKVTLPLLPTHTTGKSTHMPDLHRRNVKVLNNGERALCLQKGLASLGADVSVIEPSELDDDDTFFVILTNENGTCNETSAGLILDRGHRLIIAGTSKLMADCDTAGASGYLDMDTPLAYQLEHLDHLTTPNKPRALFPNRQTHMLEGKTALAQLADLLDAHDKTPTVWVPTTLSSLARASLTIPLKDYDFTVKEYDPSQDTPLPMARDDVIFVDRPTISSGIPQSDLSESYKTIMVIEANDPPPAPEDTAYVHQVISLPADTGYLASIVQHAGHLQ